MLSAARSEPSASVLSKEGTVAFLQSKMLPGGLEPPLPASEAGALSLKLRKHRKKYRTKCIDLQEGECAFVFWKNTRKLPDKGIA